MHPKISRFPLAAKSLNLPKIKFDKPKSASKAICHTHENYCDQQFPLMCTTTKEIGLNPCSITHKINIKQGQKDIYT